LAQRYIAVPRRLLLLLLLLLMQLPVLEPSQRLRLGRPDITLIRNSRGASHSYWLHHERGCSLLSVPPSL